MGIGKIRNLGGGIVETKKYLYKSGDECTSVTGGWKWSGTDSTNNAKYTYNKNNNTLNITRGSTGTIYNSGYVTANAIDFTKYKKLRCNNGSARLNITDINTNSGTTEIAGVTVNGVTYNADGEIDVSALSGFYYVVFTAKVGQTVSVSEIWLE